MRERRRSPPWTLASSFHPTNHHPQLCIHRIILERRRFSLVEGILLIDQLESKLKTAGKFARELYTNYTTTFSYQTPLTYDYLTVPAGRCTCRTQS